MRLCTGHTLECVDGYGFHTRHSNSVLPRAPTRTYTKIFQIDPYPNPYPHQDFSNRPVPAPVPSPKFFRSTRTRTRTRTKLSRLTSTLTRTRCVHADFFFFFVGYVQWLRRVKKLGSLFNLRLKLSLRLLFLTMARGRISMFLYIIYLNFKQYVTYRVFTLLPHVFDLCK